MNKIVPIYGLDDLEKTVSAWLLSDAPSLMISVEEWLNLGQLVYIKVPDTRFPNIEDVMILTPSDPLYTMEEYGFLNKAKKQFMTCLGRTWALPYTYYYHISLERKDFDKLRDEIQGKLWVKILEEIPKRHPKHPDWDAYNELKEKAKAISIIKTNSKESGISTEHVVRYWKGEKEAVMNELIEDFFAEKIFVSGEYTGWETDI